MVLLFKAVMVDLLLMKPGLLASRLTDPRNQIQSYVFDVVRSTVPRMDLDEAFVSKDEVGQAVLDQLREVMKDYGYEINKTLVTDLAPDNRVKASMNEINASRRLKEGNLLSASSRFLKCQSHHTVYYTLNGKNS